MNGRRAIVGLCMLCALLVSAVAAQSASAISGTTAFTCKSGGSGFSTDHCKPGEANAGFGHFAIAENTTTELTGNSNGEATKLKTTVGGLAVTLTSTGVDFLTGSMENKVDVGGANDKEHYIHGEAKLTYTGVTVNVPNCFVHEDINGTKGAKEAIETEKITATTTGQGHSMKFTPKVGTIFARFWILDKNTKTSAEGGECNIGATYNVSGSVTGKPNGATVVFNHAEVTTANTLKMGVNEAAGVKAGLEGVAALEGKDPKIGGDTFKPLAPTTVTT